MQVDVEGQWTEWPDDTPSVRAFDPTLSANPSALGDNRGCPPGYFCQYVAPGFWSHLAFWSSTPAGYARQCRLLDRQIATDGGVTLTAESAPDVLDETVVNLAAASRAVVTALAPAFTTTLLLLGAVVAGALWLSGRR